MREPHFPLFTRLPVELQDQIWQFALPDPRVYEVLDAPAPSMPRSNPANHLLFADIRNEPLPSIAGTCRSARSTVIRKYKPVVLSGTVKYLDLTRDVLLLDSYLQVRRLLKAVRLLSQVDVLRKNMTQIALGTSWGLHAGLQLRLFHRSVQTKRNMTRLLKHLAQFQKLEAVVLVVFQRSAFSLQVQWLNRQCLPWSPTPTVMPQYHHSPASQPAPNRAPIMHNPAYHYNFHVNFNLDNYWLRRPCHSSLEDYVMDDEPKRPQVKIGADSASTPEKVPADGTIKETTPETMPNMNQSPGQPKQTTKRSANDAFLVQQVNPTSYFRQSAPMSTLPPKQYQQCSQYRQDPYDAQPKPHQVRALKATFQKWVDETSIEAERPAKRPRLEAATLTWIYSGTSNTALC